MYRRVVTVSVACDLCGYEEVMEGDCPKKTSKEVLSHKGWSCNRKEDVCPTCRKNRVMGWEKDAQTGDGRETAGGPQGNITS